MLRNILFSGPTLSTTKRALDVYAERDRVLARNIANAETPGYRAQDVRFEEDLQLALRSASGGHLETTNEHHLDAPGDAPTGRVVYRNPPSKWNANGINDVDIDREMGDVARNTMRFTIAAEMVRQAYQGMRKAIYGRPM